MIVLHLGSFINDLFETDFSIFKKRVSTVKPSQEDDFFHDYDFVFSRFLFLSICQNTSESKTNILANNKSFLPYFVRK